MTLRVSALVKHLLICLLLCLSATAHAAETDRLNARGKAILQDKCARCHAIEATGDSPLRQAPPMRTIYRRFHQKELRAELSEGMVSKHREMPQIQFSDDDVYAIMTYLYTLAQPKNARPKK